MGFFRWILVLASLRTVKVRRSKATHRSLLRAWLSGEGAGAILPRAPYSHWRILYFCYNYGVQTKTKMNNKINPFLAMMLIVLSIGSFSLFLYKSNFVVSNNDAPSDGISISFVESMFKGIYRSPELAIPAQKVAKSTKSSEQTLITVDNQTDLDNFLANNGLSESDISKSNGLPNTYIVKKPKNELNSDGVSLADRKKYTALFDFSSQDAIYPQWYTDRINADDMWVETTGSVDTTVAVIDTGFGLNHEDLEGRWADGGYDFYNNDDNPIAGSTNPNGDAVSHGTMVAGLVGSTGDNGVGPASVNWKTKILPLQVLSDDGYGWTDDVAAAVNYATNQGVDVINMSLGSEASDPILKSAVDNAIESGITVVAAAGNCGSTNYQYQGCSYQGQIIYPAKYSNVIAVGATDSNNNRASFSSYGPEVDIVAPGSGAIRSTMWLPSNQTSAYNSILSGTSFSSPIVAGIAALHVGENPEITPAQLKNNLITSAQKVASMKDNYFSDAYGYGLVDVYKSFHGSACQNETDAPGSDGKQILFERHNAKKRTITWFIQRNNTQSNCQELKSWNASLTDWRQRLETNVPTLESGAEKMIFADLDGSGGAELIRVKYDNLSGKTTLFFWDNTFQAWKKTIQTNISNSAMNYGDIQAIDTNGNGKDELFYIRYNHTKSGKVEFYRWNTDYKTWSKKSISLLSTISKSRGTIIPADFNGDKVDRFHFIKYNHTKSGEVEILRFAGNLKSWTNKRATNLKTINPFDGYVVPSDINGNRVDEFNFVKRQSASGKVQIYRWRADFKAWAAKSTTNLPQY